MRGGRRRTVRVAADEAERALIWKTRKAAFAAMGRIAPNYYVQDSVIPRTSWPEVLRQIEELADEYDLQVANVFHAGDGNLHPLVLLRRRRGGRAGAGRGAGRADREGVRGRGRLDHRRARRRRGQEALHAEDVRRGRPGHVPAAALRVRPRRPGQPGQGDAHAAAVRRGARAPTASIRSRRRGWRSGCDGDGGAGRRPPQEPASPGCRRRGGRRGRSGSLAAGTKLGWGRGRGTSRRRALHRASTDPRAQRGRPHRGASRPACRWPSAQARVRRRRGRCWPSTRRVAEGAGHASAGVVATGDSGPLRHRYGGRARPRGGHDRGAVGRHARPRPAAR